MAATDVDRRRHLSAACLALVLPLALGCSTPAQALDRADGRWLRVEVVDRASGRPLTVWRHGGELWVAGTPGARYAVRLVNRSGERLLAVVAVDGVNILSGETAGSGQRGYVLSPWGHASLTGWRKSESEVAAFEFTALADSYAARTGRPGDVGVIGVAVFRERPPALAIQEPWPGARREQPADRGSAGAGAAPESERKAPSSEPSSAARAPAAMPPAPPATTAAPPAGATAIPPDDDARTSAGAARVDRGEMQAATGERLGTGHGAREFSEVVTVPFERATRAPQEVLRIRYDSLENLVALGIASRPYAWAARPRPFPADDAFVPDPPNP